MKPVTLILVKKTIAFSLIFLSLNGFSQKISAGYDYSYAICNDKTIMSWGNNQNGQLGNGTATFLSRVPVPVSNLTGVVDVSAGGQNILALKNDSTVWAWGKNMNGELGNGTNSQSNVPIQVNSLTGIIAIEAGSANMIALKGDGTVWTWGFNQNGELGNGTYTNSNIPVQVSSMSGIVAVSTGSNHSLVLKSDGTLWAWGSNWQGEFGNGTNISSNIPIQINSITGIKAISAGDGFSLVLKNDSTVWAWGSNSFGTLGNASTANSNIPVQVHTLTGITKITAGRFGSTHSLAIKNDSTVWAWGKNNSGEIGNGTLGTVNSPVKVNSLTGIIEIAAGTNHSLALQNNGTLWAWGDNSSGEIGNGTVTISFHTPTLVTGLCQMAVNVSEMENEPMEVSIYPNPTESKINIDFKRYNSENPYSYSIYNIFGQSVRHPVSLKERNSIDLSDQSKGIYFVHILNPFNQTIEVKKIVVQ